MRLNLGEKGRRGLQEDQEPDQYVGDDGRPPDRRRLSPTAGRRSGRVVTGAMIVIGPDAPLNA